MRRAAQKNHLPKISLITPTLNRRVPLEKNILNVLHQNYPNVEHIIIDGKSTDGTIEMLKKYKHLKWISEKDRNHIDAVNKGVKMATGDIITCLNSDDYFEPLTLKTVGSYFSRSWESKNYPKCLVGNLRVVNRKGKLLYISHPSYTYMKMLRFWKHEFPLNPSSYFYLRKIHDKIGIFDETAGTSYDYEFILRMSKQYAFDYIDQELGNYVFDTGTITYENWANIEQLTWNASKKHRETLPFITKKRLMLDFFLYSILKTKFHI